MSSPDLQSVLRALVAPLAVGDIVAEGYALAAISTELGPRLRLQRDGHDVLVEVSPLGAGLQSAVKTDRLGLSYRSGATEDPVPPALGLSLCRALAQLVAPNEGAA